MRPALRSLADRLLTPVRSRGRLIVWTPAYMGFGNVLYVLHWVSTARSRGYALWALETPALRPWLPVFPELTDLVVTPEQVRFSDARLMPFSPAGRERLPGGMYAAVKPLDPARPFADFLNRYLMPGLERHTPFTPRPDDRAHLWVNVRRGDYYSHPRHRQEYGFDVEAYVRVALAGTLAQDGPVEAITVVSDGIDWCQAHLSFLDDVAPVTFAPASDGPVRNFVDIAHARRLILTNSTFSYWAAMNGNVLHGDNHAEVWAPRFFDRTTNEGRSTLVDERWSIVEDIPGGWDSILSR